MKGHSSLGSLTSHRGLHHLPLCNPLPQESTETELYPTEVKDEFREKGPLPERDI